MNHYLLKNDYKQTGVPAGLNAVLTEKFNLEDPMPPMSGYSWTKTRDPNREYPERLVLVSKDKLYKFDYIRFWDGFVISKEFKDVLDKFALSYKSVKLDVIGWKNNKITDKEYHFIDIPLTDATAGIDYANSSFELDSQMIQLRGLNENRITKDGNYYGNIKTYDSLVIHESMDKEVFKLKDTVIHDIGCSDVFKQAVEEKKLYGIDFLSLDDMGRYHNYFR